MWIWLVVALLAAVGEMLTTGLFLALVAVAAAITALVALVLPVALAQVLIFAGLSLGGIAFIRPALVRAVGIDALTHSTGQVSQTRIVGRRATVTRTVDAEGGQVRIGEGEFWSARAYDPNDLIPVGAKVDIMTVDGLTALVTPVVPLPLEEDSHVISQKGTNS
jgi:membrane protein implicated in regulation of membrane protease activity